MKEFLISAGVAVAIAILAMILLQMGDSSTASRFTSTTAGAVRLGP
jgi:preprotein translocase subunit SecG